MKSEIGSEFWDVPLSKTPNHLFPKDTKWFLSGRHALEYIVIDSGIKSVSMPRWCCESMVSPFLKHDVTVCFYDEYPNLKCDAIFIINYFGITNENDGMDISSYDGIIIRDITHSIFSKRFDDADYYFGSLRKWAGFVTGGFAWGEWKKNIKIPDPDKNYVELRKQAFILKRNYINKKTNEKQFLEIFNRANQYLCYCSISGATLDDIEMANFLDVALLKERRRKNANYLIKELNLQINLSDNDVPLFVPLFISNRDKLRDYLIRKNIYCPIHWPYYDVCGTELSLVCDQRYDIEDMKRIVSVIKEYISLEEFK